MKPIQKILADWQRKMGIKPNDDLKLTYFGFPGQRTRRKIMERKCDTCIHRKEDGCEKWECEYKERTETHSCDYISRQAAIDVIVNTVSEIGLHDNSEVARYGATFRQHEIINIIEGMPSAEPEVIRCKDCEWWEKQKDSVHCGNARRRENNEA